MPLDAVSIELERPSTGKRMRIDEFKSYTMTSDLFVPGDAFEMTVAGDVDIRHGDRIKIFINNRLELTGIMRPPQRQYEKTAGATMILRGVDYMGLLTSHHIKIGQTFENMTVQKIADSIISDVPFVNRKNLTIHTGAKNIPNPASTATSRYAPQLNSEKLFRTKPGDTVFEALRRLALTQGLMFFNLPDGSLVFGTLAVPGTPAFFLNRANIKKMAEKMAAGPGYSEVTIFGPKQKTQTGFTIQLNDIQSSGQATDSKFPYYHPFVGRSKQGGSDDDMRRQAELKLAELKSAETDLTYITDGHGQGSGRARRNWSVNSIVQVDDPVFPDLSGQYLVAGRTFTMDRDNGTQTSLRLANPKYSPKI